MHELVVNVKHDSCDVYVGRGTFWGNPFNTGPVALRIENYRRMLESDEQMMDKARSDLVGKTLGCHCAPKACHADVLAEIANSPSRARA